MHIKIIVTLGPSSMDYQTIKSMINHGARIFRLNFSHDRAENFAHVVNLIRDLESEMAIPLTIMGDLSGPKIRIGEVANSPLRIYKGSALYLGTPQAIANITDSTGISLNYPELLKELSPGSFVSLSDGMLQLKVESVQEEGKLFLLRALSGGILSSNKGITFPGKTIPLAALTDKDKQDLGEALDIGIDCFALSFVQGKNDILDLQNEIAKYNSRATVIAKLERSNGVEDLEDILQAADGIMVARGDLGLECPLPSVPVIQKRVIRACRHAQKPSIVATQMLISMVQNPIPTRAETSDVANAILDGSDCVMLSEETAVGNYPVQAVRFIQEIADHAESYLLERMEGPYRPKKEKHPAKYLAYSASLLAENTESKALVCHSTTGNTASLLSSRRPAPPIYALTTDPGVINFLNFYWGVKPQLTNPDIPNHLDRVENFIQKSPLFSPGDSVILTSGQPTPGQQKTHTNQIKVYYK